MRVAGIQSNETPTCYSIEQFAENKVETLPSSLEDTLKFCIEVPTTETPLEPFKQLLTPAQSVRSERFMHQGAKRQYLTAHVALHLFLKACLGAAHHDLRWKESEHHKPYLELPDGNRPLEFNLSHCRQWVALIVGNQPVGIDIEGHKPMDDMRGVAKLVFTEFERSNLFAEETEVARRFFRHWTCKEAYLKGKGTGFMQEPKSFEMDFSVETFPGTPVVWWNESIEDHTLAWTIRKD